MCDLRFVLIELRKLKICANVDEEIVISFAKSVLLLLLLLLAGSVGRSFPVDLVKYNLSESSHH